MGYEDLKRLTEEERAALRRECHRRVASATRSVDPPNIEDLRTLEYLDRIEESGE